MRPLTEHFKISEPQDPEIDEPYVDQKRRSGFHSKFVKGSVGPSYPKSFLAASYLYGPYCLEINDIRFVRPFSSLTLCRMVLSVVSGTENPISTGVELYFL